MAWTLLYIVASLDNGLSREVVTSLLISLFYGILLYPYPWTFVGHGSLVIWDLQKACCFLLGEVNRVKFWVFKNLLGWHWLRGSYRFQGYISITLDLYIALCVHHTKSNHLLSPYIRPPPPPITPHPLPSGNHHTVVCCLFVCLMEWRGGSLLHL